MSFPYVPALHFWQMVRDGSTWYHPLAHEQVDVALRQKGPLTFGSHTAVPHAQATAVLGAPLSVDAHSPTQALSGMEVHVLEGA
jgi:hypothetical protein